MICFSFFPCILCVLVLFCLFFSSSLICLSFAVCYHTPEGMCASLDERSMRYMYKTRLFYSRQFSSIHILRLCHLLYMSFHSVYKLDSTWEKEKKKTEFWSLTNGPQHRSSTIRRFESNVWFCHMTFAHHRMVTKIKNKKLRPTIDPTIETNDFSRKYHLYPLPFLFAVAHNNLSHKRKSKRQLSAVAAVTAPPPIPTILTTSPSSSSSHHSMHIAFFSVGYSFSGKVLVGI